MENSFAVPIQNGAITALVTYHYPAPYRVEYRYYEDKGYIVLQNGEEIQRFPDHDALLGWLETIRSGTIVKPEIANIIFLRSRYEPEAIQIYGSDLDCIGKKLGLIYYRQYATAQELLDHCTPNYDY